MMPRTVLMIAFHFPPAAMSSGHLRTLGFARYLPAAGWEPVILSASPCAYPRTAPIRDGVIPQGCHVYRALALDTRRHFGVAGKYPGILALPDRWRSWWVAGVLEGLRLIRRYRIAAIWSTYPIMTAHCIAHTLHRVTGLPWIADFRDPVGSSVSSNRLAVASQWRWEHRVLCRANRVVLTTPGAERDYAGHYPEAERQQRLAVIQNGYDEADFASLRAASAPHAGPLVLLHSGLLYPEGRDPSAFFNALAKLKGAGTAGPDRIRVVLRASGSETRYQKQIDRFDIADVVTLAPQIGNREALLEQASADGLLLFQGERFDRQIPAKVYEYLRVGKPIFALAGENGDTAALLRETGGAELAPLKDATAIEKRLAGFIAALRDGRAPTVSEEVARRYSRREGAVRLAALLDGLPASHGLRRPQNIPNKLDRKHD